MAVQPRVIFTQFSSVDSTEFRPWIEHRDRVLGKLSPARTDVDNPTVWQLVLQVRPSQSPSPARSLTIARACTAGTSL